MKKFFLSSVAIFAAAVMFSSCSDCKECTYQSLPGSYKVCDDGSLEYCVSGTCVPNTDYNGSQQEIIDALEAAGFTCN